MKTAVKSDFNSKILCESKSLILRIHKEKRMVDIKFYQKLFVVFLSLSTILIFPESPRELENICNNYNSTKLCNIW